MISPSKKLLLVKFVDFICENCKKKFKIEKLEIHRINRGCNGGNYSDFRNLKVLCSDCHKKIHLCEF